MYRDARTRWAVVSQHTVRLASSVERSKFASGAEQAIHHRAYADAVDLTAILGTAAAILEFARASGDLVGWVSREFPEHSRFWKLFEKQLKHEHDLDWELIRSRCYLQPEFFGLALALIAGEPGAEDAMRQHFASFIVPPAGGRYSKEESVERMLSAARTAAAEAPESDRQAGLAQRLLLEQRLTQEFERLEAQLSAQGQDVTEILRLSKIQVDSFVELKLEVTRIRQRLDQLQVPSYPAEGALLDREAAEQMLAAQTEDIDRRVDQAMRKYLREAGEPIVGPARPELAPSGPAQSTGDPALDLASEPEPPSVPGSPPVSTTTEPATPGREDERPPRPEPPAGGTAAPKKPRRPRPGGPTGATPRPTRRDGAVIAARRELARLRELDAQSARRLEALLDDDGVAAVDRALREGALDQGPVVLLAAAAGTVAAGGHSADAEAAYLRAAELATDAREKARNFARASVMAYALGATDRASTHQAAARALAADHPALLIAEARQSRDGEFMLRHVRDVVPESDTERALLHATRAQAHILIGEEDQAWAEFGQAREADAENLAVRELSGLLPWWSAHEQIRRGETPDDAQLAEAGRNLEELALEITTQQRPAEVAQILARASECYMLAGEFDDATRVLESIRTPGVLDDEVRATLGQAAMTANRPDLVLRFVRPETDDPAGRLARAEAASLTAVGRDRDAALAELRGLMDDDDEAIRNRAAFGLLAAASAATEIEWDERAAALVRAESPATEAAMRAERALELGDADEARRILLPHASTLAARRRLRDYAALGGDWVEAADRSRELLREAGDPRDRLALAEALRQTGDAEAAERELSALAHDGNAPDDARDRAFEARMGLLPRRDYERVLAMATEWRSALPNSDNASWNLLFALARLARYDEAWQLVREAELAVATPERAQLLAEVLYRAAPRPEALRRLIDLSDLFDGRIEALEALVMLTALDADSADIATDAATEERVRETIEQFPQRFPDSTVIRTIPAPQNPEEVPAFLEALAGDRPEHQRAAANAIRDGVGPVNVLAALSGAGVAGTWMGLGALPLAFGDDASTESDRLAASEAVGKAAIWDSSSIAVSVLLGRDVPEIFRSALPGSEIVPDTLEDADAELASPGTPVARTFTTPEGEHGVAELSPEQLDRELERARRAVALAKSFSKAPGDGDGVDQALADELRKLERDGPRELRALVASLALAQRTGRPLYSDDRWVRRAAQTVGIASFGTLALIDALTEREVLDQPRRAEMRLALAGAGGWGIGLSREELLTEARQARFVLTPKLAGALHDRAHWRSRPALYWQELANFLAVVHDEAPDTFRVWVLRALDAMQQAVPEMSKAWTIELMISSAWVVGLDDPASSDDFFNALLEEAKRLPSWLGDRRYDPVLGPMQSILAYAGELVPGEEVELFKLMLRRLRGQDQLRAFLTFTRP